MQVAFDALSFGITQLDNAPPRFGKVGQLSAQPRSRGRVLNGRPAARAAAASWCEAPARCCRYRISATAVSARVTRMTAGWW